MEGDPYDHPPLSGFTDEILSPGDNIFAECVLPTACGEVPHAPQSWVAITVAWLARLFVRVITTINLHPVSPP